MFVTFDREPLGWIHPFYRQQPRQHRPRHCFSNWDNFVRPALDTVSTLNQLLQMAEPHLVNSLGAQRAERNQEKFEVKMDVKQFAPEELDVKMVGNCVIVEGKHEEKQDEQGYISRHFVRRYQLPEDVKPETVTCNLSSDGVLLVSAPRMIEQKQENEITVPINFTGEPAVTEKEEEGTKEEAVKEDANKPEKMEEAASA